MSVRHIDSVSVAWLVSGKGGNNGTGCVRSLLYCALFASSVIPFHILHCIGTEHGTAIGLGKTKMGQHSVFKYSISSILFVLASNPSLHFPISHP